MNPMIIVTIVVLFLIVSIKLPKGFKYRKILDYVKLLHKQTQNTQNCVTLRILSVSHSYSQLAIQSVRKQFYMHIDI